MSKDMPEDAVVAGLDVGSNSIRLIIAKLGPKGPIPLLKERFTPRLGEEVARTRRLSAGAANKALEVFALCRKRFSAYRVTRFRACGTAALRTAVNAADFVDHAAIVLGGPFEVISGEEEARLSLLGALSFRPDADKKGGPVLLLDVGGGSTEIVFSEDASRPTWIKSLALGAVGLTEAYLQGEKVDPPGIIKLTRHILNALGPRHANLAGLGRAFSVIGTGGTGAALAALDLDLSEYDPARIHGHILTQRGLTRLWERLSSLSLSERSCLPALGPGRADIILAGLKVYQVFLELTGQDRLLVSEAGLLEGILLSCLA